MVEPLVRVDDDFEDEYPRASALATECWANLWRAAELLMELHNRQTFDQYQLSPSARQVLAIVDELLPSLHARERDVMAAALSPSEQRSLLRSLAKLQRAALEARSAPVVHGPTRRRSGRRPG